MKNLDKTQKSNVIVCFLGSGEQIAVDETQLLDLTGWRDDLQELKKGNLLLEREKLNLEIKMLKLKMAKLGLQDTD